MNESPTDQLREEHELVLMVVEAMEREVEDIERTGRVHTDRVESMVDFTRNFTDGCHHHKEENVLFPALEERSSAAGGPVSIMLSEHQAARECIRLIDPALTGRRAGRGDRAAGAARHRREPAALRLPPAAAHRQGGHRPVRADRRAAQRPGAGEAGAGVRAAGLLARRGGAPRATTAWRTTWRRAPSRPPREDRRPSARASDRTRSAVRAPPTARNPRVHGSTRPHRAGACGDHGKALQRPRRSPSGLPVRHRPG